MQTTRIRVYRWLLWSLTLVVLVSVAANYIQTWRMRDRSIRPVPGILGADLLRAAKDIEYVERREGAVQFKLRAAELKETRGGQSLLEGIEAFDLNPDGTVRNQIRSRQAEYDRNARRALFSGDVRLSLGSTVQVRTDSLNYDLAAGLGATDDLVELDSPGARGTAKGIRYLTDGTELEMCEAVRFTVNRVKMGSDGSAQTESYRITAKRGKYSGARSYVQLEGGVHVESEQGTLAGESLEARLSADGGRATALACIGDAVYVSILGGQRQRLQGNRLDFEIADRGTIRSIDVNGHGLFTEDRPEGRQELSGEHIHIDLDPVAGLPAAISSQGLARLQSLRGAEATTISGQALDARFAAGTNLLQSIAVSGNSRMELLSPAAASADRLEAEWLQLTFGGPGNAGGLREIAAEGSVKWYSESRKQGETPSSRSLGAESLRLNYSSSGGFLESGLASGHVVVAASAAESPGAATVRRLQCDTTHFTFFPGSSILRQLDGTGHVEVYYSRPASAGRDVQEMRTTSTDIRAAFREAGGKPETISQWGGFSYRDGSRQISAQRCDYNAGQRIMTLRGSPRIVDRGGDTRGNVAEYHEGDMLLRVLGRVRTVMRAASAAGDNFITSASNTGAPAIVTAESVDYRLDSSTATYSGNVQVLSESGQLQAKVLTLSESGATVEASGGISHLIQDRQGVTRAESEAPGAGAASQTIRIRSDSLRYNSKENALLYAGEVAAESSEIRLLAGTLEAYLDRTGRRIERSRAEKQVRISQRGREARGDSADYYLNPGKFVVTGSPAAIFDLQGGQSSAHRLTFFTLDDRILLEKP